MKWSGTFPNLVRRLFEGLSYARDVAEVPRCFVFCLVGLLNSILLFSPSVSYCVFPVEKRIGKTSYFTFHLSTLSVLNHSSSILSCLSKCVSLTMFVSWLFGLLLPLSLSPILCRIWTTRWDKTTLNLTAVKRLETHLHCKWCYDC